MRPASTCSSVSSTTICTAACVFLPASNSRRPAASAAATYESGSVRVARTEDPEPRRRAASRTHRRPRACPPRRCRDPDPARRRGGAATHTYRRSRARRRRGAATSIYLVAAVALRPTRTDDPELVAAAAPRPQSSSSPRRRRDPTRRRSGSSPRRRPTPRTDDPALRRGGAATVADDRATRARHERLAFRARQRVLDEDGASVGDGVCACWRRGVS